MEKAGGGGDYPELRKGKKKEDGGRKRELVKRGKRVQNDHFYAVGEYDCEEAVWTKGGRRGRLV